MTESKRPVRPGASLWGVVRAGHSRTGAQLCWGSVRGGLPYIESRRRTSSRNCWRDARFTFGWSPPPPHTAPYSQAPEPSSWQSSQCTQEVDS